MSRPGVADRDTPSAADQSRGRDEPAEGRAEGRGRAPDPLPAEAGGAVPALEWACAGVGLLLVAGTIGFMGYRAVAGDDGPADPVAWAEEVRPLRGGFRVGVRARNEGGSAAAEVEIEGELRRGGEVVERSGTRLDYLAAGSEREAGLVFERDPRGLELRVRAKGFREP